MNGVRASAEASSDELEFARTVSSLSPRGLAILKRIMTHLEPPGARPVTKEQVAGWLREEGAGESVIDSYLKSMEALERSQP